MIAKTIFKLWSWIHRRSRLEQGKRHQAPPRALTSVDLTPQQRDLLRPCWRRVEKLPHCSGRSGAVIAQVHQTHMTAFVLDHEQATAVRSILGGQT